MPRKGIRNYEQVKIRERERARQKRWAQNGKPQRVSECSQSCCPYWNECSIDLWRVCPNDQGLLYVPLRCFKEHPLYRKDEWTGR